MSTTSTSNALLLPKLKDGQDGFSTWKFRLNLLLEEKGIEIKIKPETKEERQADIKARSLIAQCVCDKYIEIIKKCQTAAEMMKRLEEVFERKSVFNQLYLRKQLLSMKATSCEKLQDHFLKFDTIISSLESTGATLKDNDKVCHLLLTLPSEYDTVITTLETIDTVLTVDFVKSRLLDAELKLKGKESTAVENDQYSFMTCYKCGRRGHKSFQCRMGQSAPVRGIPRGRSTQGRQSYSRGSNHSRGRGVNYRASWQSTRAAQAQEEDDKSSQLTFTAFSTRDTSQSVSDNSVHLVVDSGATEHMIMAKYEQYMTNIVYLDKEMKIYVANGQYLTCVKRGKLKLVYNDKVKIDIEGLIVSNLSHNLLSVRKLLRKGLQVRFYNDNVSINNTKTRVVGNLRDKLYIIEMKLQIDHCLISKDLWHQRLGHANRHQLKLLQLPYSETPCEPCMKGKTTRLPFKSVLKPRSKCIGELIHTDISGPVTEPTLTAPMTQVVAVAGEPVYLPCDVATQDEDDAVLLVLWYREDLGTPIYSVDAREKDFGVAERWSDESVFASRAYFLPERRPAELGVDRVRATDQGVYRCRVDFKQAQTRNSRVNLTVIVPPNKMVITDDKGDVKQAIVGPYVEGDTFTLKCDVFGGRPRPWVKWFRNEVETDTPATTLQGSGVRGVLRVGPLTRADVRATLTCRASNHLRTHPIETTLTLDMNFPPLNVHILGSNQPLSASRRYDLLCQSSGSRPPASITWWKNGHRINNAKETLSTDGNTTTSTVSIQLTKADAGAKLACRASNPQMASVPALENDWILDIQYVPETVVRLGTNLDPTNIREGSDVYFDCIIKAHPYVYKVEWRHNGKTLHHNVGQGVIISNQSLVLQGVGRKTAGNYTCVGFNAEGDGESKPFTLDVLYAPTCRSSQQRVHGVAKQERAHITCQVDANPPEVSFRWTFNNTANSNEVSDTYVSRAGTSSTVTYTPHTEMDYGTLLCWAHNRIGKQRVPCVYHIIAAGRPDQVHNCTVVNASLTSFGVRCSEGFNGGMPQSFLLEVREIVTQEIVANVSSAVPRFTAVGLVPGRTYAAAVLAYNAKGRGDPYPLRASTLRPPEKHHVHDKSLDLPRTAFQMSGAMSAAVGGGGVLMVALVLFMIAVRQRCAKRKPRSGPPPSQPASPDKLREKDDSESDDRNPDIIPSDTDHNMQITLLQETGLAHQMDYFRQQQVSTISPPNSRGPRGSIAGVRGGIPGYCPLRTAPPSHPPIHDNNTQTPGIPPPAGFAGSCTLPRNTGSERCIPMQHLRTLPRTHPHPHAHPHPPRDTPL